MDLVFLAPAVTQHGVDPEPVLASHPLTRDLDPAAITAVVCVLAGYWTRESNRPAGSQLTALHRHRIEAGRAAIAWLRRRVGWG